MKKVLCLLLMSIVICSTMFSVSAKSVITVGDWTVEKTDKNELSVVSCSSSGEITMITEIGGMNVTAVGDYAFAGSDTLQAFTAHVPLREIGDYVFQNASQLQSVALPSSLTKIGVFAFAGTSSLAEADLRNTAVEAIPAYAFMSSGIQRAVIPHTTVRIANNAFLNCQALKTIYIPDSVTDIGEKAFDGCDDLTILCKKDSYAEQYAKAHGISDQCVILCGDADDDGEVTIMDVTVIQRVLIDISVRAFDEAAADVDRNGLDITDAAWIQRFLADFPNYCHVGEFLAI